jgi:hypothetical protein
MSGIGPIEFGWWQTSHFRCRIGATSLENVTGSGGAARTARSREADTPAATQTAAAIVTLMPGVTPSSLVMMPRLTS